MYNFNTITEAFKTISEFLSERLPSDIFSVWIEGNVLSLHTAHTARGCSCSELGNARTELQALLANTCNKREFWNTGYYFYTSYFYNGFTILFALN